ncbi:D-2-hydroxyacid dehydrogenase [Aliikangiella marina]|uniref:D-2-hydroxyacid dehydrogenase n=1 Tax=Aliikangiella marina TaxID=1712262 RepID=A0A545TCA0_9GAMM|nr:D-2-hydroxyacid dehydrogenase [Aliikangiella marina]TQV74839.1 D-2-hydroxyacid dehydrogenase [Aliikangiella marina]
MKAVFLDRATIDSSVSLTPISSLISVLQTYPSTCSTETVKRAQDFDIIITNKVIIDEAVISQLPKLKLICVAATGTNNIDHLAAKKAGVQVANVVDYSTSSVAQHVFAYLLDYYNQVNLYHRENQKYPWNESHHFCQFHAPVNELAGQKLGIIGYGNIGKHVAKIAKAFDIQVTVAERNNVPSIRSGRAAFEAVIANSDIISLHCPLTPESHKLFSAETFKIMKPSCLLINTARGPIIDSDALAHALTNGELAHAIIDVLEQEPPQENHPLLDLPAEKLTLTHHIAWGSLQAQHKLIQGIANNISSFR